ncbi:unnamed product [Ostreococcus tauri]|uniref:Unnamed product n=1 Tax=Ostreococcus tauri TaxID=70448 RepID=A0A090N3G5_OSTTA|nr:unnamed product [Ostreococcus tauri]OUS47846.1 hypothetical protein BE221DRAFT_20039 [Ostreococcus tauri]CEF98078.1 unnamed product [Ostreococcus tauri]|eukprot:XP_022839067.1 unnamed product [Ostreococcus tauri]
MRGTVIARDIQLPDVASGRRRLRPREVTCGNGIRRGIIVSLFNRSKANKEPDWTAMEGEKRTVSDEIGRRQFANRRANNGKDRKDLYTENWDGSEYKGGSFNILSLVAALFVLVPVALLIFAYTSYGTLWG